MSELESAREARRWLRFATEDLTGAVRVVADPTVAPRLACVLAQQAAEKALKAALIFLQIDYPRRHDLSELRELIPAGWDIKTG
jgi:HEPN domain-containing protein